MSCTAYTVTLHIDPTRVGAVGHAFLTLSAPGQPDINIGYYPITSGNANGPGTVRNDSYTEVIVDSSGNVVGLEEHPYAYSKTFTVTEMQYSDMLAYAAQVAQGSNNYQAPAGALGLIPSATVIFGDQTNVCTDFARAVLAAGGISGTSGHDPASFGSLPHINSGAKMYHRNALNFA